MVDLALVALVCVVVLALAFDFTNGFHDGANAVATAVATKAIPARWAPPFSACFNFLAFFIVGTAVADTVASIVQQMSVTTTLIFCALLSAIAWNILTWRLGLPSSSSHAIIGALVGAGIAAGGTMAITWSKVGKAVIGIGASPLIAFTVAALVMGLAAWLIRRRLLPEDHVAYKGVQLASAAALSFGHGANDAQKTIGVLGALLAGAGAMGVTIDDGRLVVPLWVSLACYLAIAAGTWSGGWRIIETMGLRITRLVPVSGAAANIGSCTAVFGATALGVPISTTQAVVFSIVGSGVASGAGARWRTLRGIILGWLVTMPGTALIAYAIFSATRLPGPLPWILIGGGSLVGLAWFIRAVRSAPGAADIENELEHPPAGEGELTRA